MMGDLDYVKCSVRNNGQRSTNIDDGNLLLRSLRANYIKRKRHRFLTILLLKDYGTFQYDNVRYTAFHKMLGGGQFSDQTIEGVDAYACRCREDSCSRICSASAALSTGLRLSLRVQGSYFGRFSTLSQVFIQIRASLFWFRQNLSIRGRNN